jgi:hypothetical protein
VVGVVAIDGGAVDGGGVLAPGKLGYAVGTQYVASRQVGAPSTSWPAVTGGGSSSPRQAALGSQLATTTSTSAGAGGGVWNAPRPPGGMRVCRVHTRQARQLPPTSAQSASVVQLAAMHH